MESWFTDRFAQDVWETKYKGNAENIYDYFKGLAKNISLGDQRAADRFFRLMWEKRFSPGGRILAYGGRPDARLSLMNCTTHKIMEDSLESISDTAYTIMRASSRGQGIGIDLSRLRPAGAPVNNAAKTSTGAISFMELLNTIGGTIGQEGRRAALLFSLRVDHPDLFRPGEKDVPCPRCNTQGCDDCSGGYLPYDFLHVKKLPGLVENANISVRVTNAFMEAVINDKPWTLCFSGASSGGPFHVERTVPAKELFMALARSAHRAAEPGLLYWDTSKRMSNSDLFGERWGIVGVNACSEEILDQDGLCNLGSMNLAAYVTDPFTPDARFQYEAFALDVQTAVEFLDNVITVEMENGNYISKTQYESLRHIRRIGLGAMGTADMLAMLNLTYGGSIETIQLLRKVFETLRDAAYKATIELARKRGPAEVWNVADDYHGNVVKGGFFATLPEALKADILRFGTRNITVLSIAPTGSISNLYGVSSGIEPLFAHSYIRRTRMSGEDRFVDYLHPGVRFSRSLGKPDSIWPTAYDVTPEEHLLVQAVAQEYLDASVAKTLNFPASATVKDVADAYLTGWHLGLKGMTVYVDGSRTEQILYRKEETQGGSEKCVACGSELVFKEGCVECPACGWGKCSL